ncbi:MAG: tetratricopeptide repeat protein [bacterium]
MQWLTLSTTSATFRFLFGLVLVSAIIFSLFPVSNVDIWWHLKTGQYILENHTLPSHDIFTYTIPQETRWHDVQWLFQIIVALLYSLGGWNALIGLRILCIMILTWLLWRWLLERGYTAGITSFTILIILLASRYRFFVRPELFSFVFITILLWQFDRFVRKGTFSIGLTLFVQWLWANTHTSCILGCLTATIFVSERWFITKSLVIQNNKRKPFITNLGIYLILFYIVTLLNPHGWIMLTYGFTEGRKLYIGEFQPIHWPFFLGASGICILLALTGFKSMLKKENRFFWILSLLLLIPTWRMNRFFPYLAIALAPVQAYGCMQLIQLISRFNRIRVFKFAYYTITIIVLMFLVWFTFLIEKKQSFHFGVDNAEYPVAAADFVIRENIRGRVFHISNDGGYLIWRFYPDRKVFAFNETKLNQKMIERCIQTQQSDSLRQLLDEYKVTYAILPCNYMDWNIDGKTVGTNISSWKDWSLIFWDDTSMVLIKNLPEYQPIIDRYAYQELNPEELPYPKNTQVDLSFLPTVAKDTIRWNRLLEELNRASAESSRRFRAEFTLAYIGMHSKPRNLDVILTHLEAARKITKDYAEWHSFMGQVMLEQGKNQEAIKYFQQAIQLTGKSLDSYYNLAIAYVKIGDRQSARKIVDKILEIDPNHARAKNLLSKIQ